MPSPARTPLILAVVIATGFAARFLREAQATGPQPSATAAALDSQLARVQAAASASSAGRARRPTSARGSAVARPRAGTVRARGRASAGGGRDERTGPTPRASAPRVERTPFGALPLEVLAARARDSAHRANVAAARARETNVQAPSSPSVSKRVRPVPAPAPPRATGPVDLETAASDVIEALPGIGPALARRIVEDRERLGPFGSLAGLQRVRGIGPALARRLRGRVTFTEPGRP